MTEAEELKVRAQAESQALSLILQFALSQYVVSAGEQAVTAAKLSEAQQEKKE